MARAIVRLLAAALVLVAGCAHALAQAAGPEVVTEVRIRSRPAVVSARSTVTDQPASASTAASRATASRSGSSSTVTDQLDSFGPAADAVPPTR